MLKNVFKVHIFKLRYDGHMTLCKFKMYKVLI